VQSFLNNDTVFSYLHYVKNFIPKKDSFSVKKKINKLINADTYYYANITKTAFYKAPQLYQAPYLPQQTHYYPSFLGMHYGRTHFLKFINQKNKCYESHILHLKNDGFLFSDCYPNFDFDLFTIINNVGKNTAPGYSYSGKTKKN